MVPPQLHLTVRTLEEVGRGEALHNRYILTDVGGLQFAYGLDEKRGTYDDLSVLGADSYLMRWSQYANGAPEFKQVSEKPICGGT